MHEVFTLVEAIVEAKFTMHCNEDIWCEFLVSLTLAGRGPKFELAIYLPRLLCRSAILQVKAWEPPKRLNEATVPRWRGCLS